MKTTEPNFTKLIPNELVMSEVLNDMTTMFAQKRNLSTEYTYGRMSDVEFVENLKKYTQANITGWMGWNNAYSDIIAARLLNKTGYRTSASDIGMFLSVEDNRRINEVISSTIDMFLSNSVNVVIK